MQRLRLARGCVRVASTKNLSSFDQQGLRPRSEENEDLFDVTLNALDLFADDIEADSLGEGAALADSHDITGLDTEGGGAVS